MKEKVYVIYIPGKIFCHSGGMAHDYGKACHAPCEGGVYVLYTEAKSSLLNQMEQSELNKVL